MIAGAPQQGETSLAGRCALVTGASRGIGRAIALGLAASGAELILVSRNAARLAEVESAVTGYGVPAHVIVADLADPDVGTKVLSSVGRTKCSVDVLVNVAGLINRRDDLALPAVEWDAVFAVNSRACFLLCQALGGQMLARGGGSIINIASLAASQVTGSTAVYSASKAAVRQLTKVLAARWAPKVRVNSISPGYVATDLNEEWLAVPENVSYVLEHTPAKRLGMTQDVVNACLFLAAPASGFITGHDLVVDGGWSVG